MLLKPKYACGNCQKSKDIKKSRLITCCKCYVTKYCNEICKKEHYEEHKLFCKKMDSLYTVVHLPRSDSQFQIAQAYFDYGEQFHDFYAYERAFKTFEGLARYYTSTYHCNEFNTFILLHFGMFYPKNYLPY